MAGANPHLNIFHITKVKGLKARFLLHGNVLWRVQGMGSANKPTQRGELDTYFFAMLGGEVVTPRGCILSATAT
jgi:hypothetical protein